VSNVQSAFVNHSKITMLRLCRVCSVSVSNVFLIDFIVDCCEKIVVDVALSNLTSLKVLEDHSVDFVARFPSLDSKLINLKVFELRCCFNFGSVLSCSKLSRLILLDVGDIKLANVALVHLEISGEVFVSVDNVLRNLTWLSIKFNARISNLKDKCVELKWLSVFCVNGIDFVLPIGLRKNINSPFHFNVGYNICIDCFYCR